MAKLYVTKYCLTNGVYEAEGDIEGESSYVHLRYSFGGKDYLQLGRDVFESIEEAKENFLKRKEKEISSMEKELAELKELKFFYARRGKNC
jgi:hypothetical protein